MTLRLVSDMTNVARLPEADVAAGLRALASAIEGGKLERAETILLVSLTGGMVDFAAVGKSPTIAETLGLLDLAHAKIVAGSFR
jgi:hypothetical protein